MLWLLLPLVLVLSYYFLVKPQLYWKRKNVKQRFPVPFFGDNLRVFFRKESILEMFHNIYKQFKNERYCGTYQGTLPILLLREPDLIKQICVKDFDHFVDHRSFTTDAADPIWSKNLFALSGDAWREMRATLSPTFTSSKMKAMFILMEQSAKQYVDYYLSKNQKSMDIELKDSFTRFANDVIANCAFGITVDSLKEPKNAFYVNGKDITDFTGFFSSLRLMFVLVAPKIAEFFKIGMFPRGTTKFFTTLVADTVKLREEKNIQRPDMLNLLIDARKGRLKYDESTEQKDAGFATVEESHVGKVEVVQKGELTDDDIAAQVLIFFFAGFETISTMMAFMCYELAIHPDIQAKLRREVDKTLAVNNGKLTYELLNKMKYMDMVVSESMRKNPPAVAVDRKCTKAYTIQAENPHESPIDLVPGDSVWIPIFGIHHDENYYPNPEKFDPERFSDENKANIKPYTYIPFGNGPRNCIGSRFALMEVKTLIFHILSKFELSVIEKTVIPIKYSKASFNPAIEGGIWVGFKQRDL